MHPVLFKIGPTTVYAYGFFMAAAFFIAYFMAQKKADVLGLSRGAVSDLFFILLLSGVAGARLFYVLQHPEEYRGQWVRVWMIQEGGLVWYGGFLTAALTGILVAWFRKWPILKWADFLAPYLSLGQAIGRIGCFLNGCCFGKPCDLPWAVRFPESAILRHPVQLYEAAASFLIFLYLLSVLNRKSHKEGSVIVLYIFLYGTARFAIEFLRGDQTLTGGLTPPQWTSLLLILGAFFLQSLIRRRKTS